MASFRGHLACSSLLGTAYASYALWHLQMDWGLACLGAGLTALAGLLPDLDSDSSVPRRELFGLAATTIPLLLLRRLLVIGLPIEETLVVLGGVYLAVRYGAHTLLGYLTVHRGMFHSIPAMLIVGLLVYVIDHGPHQRGRMFLACGAMLGFMSHLILDELCRVDLLGMKLRTNKYAGSALKFFSPSWGATALTYGLLAYLIFLVYQERPIVFTQYDPSMINSHSNPKR